MTPRVPRVLTIAGSDSGGGAGIAADLKAFASCGTYGMCAVTAVTAQNTVGVEAVHVLPAEMIVAQVRAVSTDIGVDAVKVGMLANSDVVRAVERALDLVGKVPVVVDPVMASETGRTLLDVPAREELARRIVPKATVVCPNASEAMLLAGQDDGDLLAAARAILGLGCTAVVVTGGHTDARSDLYVDARSQVALAGAAHGQAAGHGSGCTHSAALAAQLALGLSPLEAARLAQAIAARSIENALEWLGQGRGPVDVCGLQAKNKTS